ncbi:MAG TPA: MaoC family dehydratase [Gammaproteobacteria bacterium]|nr:MaoC family dehydratase [Gammaproteobacteria bacterium]
MSIEYYWEDFTVGRTIDLGSREVSRDEVLGFANRYDPQSFHVDAAAAEASIYGGLIASGWHTAAMVMRLMCDGYLLRSASLGSPGIDNLRWLKPVRPGDTLRARMTVLESRPSSSKPDRGTIKSSWEVFNQRGELVMSMEGFGMFRRRQSAA